jgi:hypothetical protein
MATRVPPALSELRTGLTIPSSMTETRKARWSFRLAVLGSVLAVVSAAFSAYQWLDSRREHRITTAIEISRNYIKETADETSNAIHEAAMGHKMSVEEALTVPRGANTLEYIAFLANNGRINEDYLSEELKCAMKWASEGAKISSGK